MIAACTCLCGSSDQLARQTLKKYGYEGWLSIPVPQGKEKSLRMLERIPRTPEVEMLENYIKNASKWVVIIGWNENGCRWTDVAHRNAKAQVEAQLIVEAFA